MKPISPRIGGRLLKIAFLTWLALATLLPVNKLSAEWRSDCKDFKTYSNFFEKKILYIDMIEYVKSWDVEKVRWLLRQWLNPNITDYSGFPLLSLAAKEWDFEMAKLLIEYCADVNKRKMYWLFQMEFFIWRWDFPRSDFEKNYLHSEKTDLL